MNPTNPTTDEERQGAKSDVMFHVAPSLSRTSIRMHGLDVSFMQGRGIAGSATPESQGVHLSDTLSAAYWYASFETHTVVDVWQVDVASLDLREIDGGWLCVEPILADRLRLRVASLSAAAIRSQLDSADTAAPAGGISVEMRRGPGDGDS